MTVSIIIITLNEEKYLPELLSDLAKQTALDTIGEILVVDGGSADDTKGAVKKFENILPIRFVAAPKKGWAAQKNYGVKQTKHDHILFLDADLRVPKNLVAKLATTHSTHPSSVITPRVMTDSRNPVFSFGALITFLYFKILRLFGKQAASDQAVYIAKSDFKTIKGLDESLLHGADLDFMEKAQKAGIGLVIPWNPAVKASVRRYKEVGVFTLFFRYVRSEIHRHRNGGVVSKDYIGYSKPIPQSRRARLVKKIIFYVLLAVVLLLLLIEVIGQLYAYRNRNIPITWGASFSVKYAEELGIPWPEAYTATVSDLGVKHVRVMTYWDRVEPANNQYAFQEIDWQIAEAKKYDAKIMLTVGLRQPRWPECHQAKWAADLQMSNKTQWQTELDEYITKTLQRYKNEPAVESVQLENEYMNRNFGECNDFSRERLQHELDVVRKHAAGKRVYITTGDQTGFPVIGPMADSSGTSLYTRTYAPVIGYYNSWLRPSWYGTRSVFTNALHDQPMIISELQAEPWGPKATVDLSLEEQDKSMSVQQLTENFQFARDTGIKEVYAWGVEWWYWRKEIKQDPSMWNAAKEVYRNN